MRNRLVGLDLETSQIQMKDPVNALRENEAAMHVTKPEFEKTLTEQLDRLREEIHEMRAKSLSLEEAAFTRWSKAMADLEAKQTAARERHGCGDQSSDCFPLDLDQSLEAS